MCSSLSARTPGCACTHMGKSGTPGDIWGSLVHLETYGEVWYTWRHMGKSGTPGDRPYASRLQKKTLAQTYTQTHLAGLQDELQRAHASLHHPWVAAVEGGDEGSHSLALLWRAQLIRCTTTQAAQGRGCLYLWGSQCSDNDTIVSTTHKQYAQVCIGCVWVFAYALVCCVCRHVCGQAKRTSTMHVGTCIMLLLLKRL